MFSELQRVFPPPRYMTLPSVGIDMSDTSLKYVYLIGSRTSSSDAELVSWGDIPIPEGTLVEGKIQDVQKLVPVLQQVRERCKVPYVRLSLPEEHAYIFETDIKRDMPEREIRGLLEFKLQENVPISPRDAFFDYDVIVETADENIFHATVAVYGKAMLLKYYEACTLAGLTPLSFEVESQALARAVVRPSCKNATLVVDFGKTHAGIGIVYKNTLMYTSAIGGSGDALSTAMRRVLGQDVPEDELTAMKNEHGLRRTHKNNDVQEALLSAVDKMSEELRSHIRYWNAREGERKERAVTEVVLSGGSSNLAGLPEYFSDALSLPVHRAEVWQHVFSLDSFVPPIDRQHSYGYATAVGLALVNTTSTDV